MFLLTLIRYWLEDAIAQGVKVVCFAVANSGSTTYFLLRGIELKTAIALPLGHLLASFSDSFTIAGVQLFYANPVLAMNLSNPRRRLKTGGAGESWVLANAIAILREQYAVGTIEVKMVLKSGIRISILTK